MSPRDPHRDVDVPPERPRDGSITRPSRDDASAAEGMEELRTGSAREDDQSHLAQPRRDPEASKPGDPQPPHLTENDEDAPVQDEVESPDDVPVLPANASGSDQVGTDKQQNEVDDESAYENRPEEDKSWEP